MYDFTIILVGGSKSTQVIVPYLSILQLNIDLSWIAA